jgi:hypothetical protein
MYSRLNTALINHKGLVNINYEEKYFESFKVVWLRTSCTGDRFFCAGTLFNKKDWLSATGLRGTVNQKHINNRS